MNNIRTKIRKVTAGAAVFIGTAITTMYAVSAKVKIKEGVKKATDEITSQFKGVIPLIFGVVAMICLVFTIFKAIKAFLAYRRNEEINALPIVLGLIGTIVASLASAWSFFAAFGLGS